MKSIEIAAAPAAVWSALVETGARRPWYYNLQPAGEFRVGEVVRWLQADGKEAEVSTVREVAPPKRLVLESRFLFTPAVAGLPPHTLTYEVKAAGAGSQLTMRVQGATGHAAQLLVDEGDAILQGLRLALDPAAQAELARLEEIGAVEIRDVTPDRLGDYQAFFDRDAFRDYPAWQFCYCMETHFGGTPDEQIARTGADNRRDMSQMIADGQVTALLAYAEGKPVAWCNYGPTPRLAGIMQKLKLDPAEQAGVGSIACFVIAAPYRGHGLATRLLDAACERLAARGLKWAEAYPARSGDSPQHNFRGPLAMYLAAGFEPYRELERQVVVRKRL